VFGIGKKEPAPVISAIIVAAGGSTRMEGMDKQQLPLDNIPVVVRSVAAFCSCERISEVVLVCPEADMADYYALVREYALEKVTSVVGGGETRQDSVYKGMNACRQDAVLLAVHDGARPLVELSTIEDCIDDALRYGAAAAGVPIKDTVKVCGAAGFVESTPDRDRLVAIQTPQIFSAGLYRAAMMRARQMGHTYTDDCQLMEQAGYRVFVTRGSYHNIKITTPEDVVLADAILDYREEAML